MHHLAKLTTGTIALGLLTVALTGLAPTAAADPFGGSGPNCYQVYIFEGQVGPVTVDASDSCPEVDVDTEWRPSTTDNTIPPCAGIADEKVVGPATIWLNEICQVGVVVDAGPAGTVAADTDRTDGEDVEYEPGSAVPAHGTGIHCDYDPKTMTGYCYFD